MCYFALQERLSGGATGEPVLEPDQGGQLVRAASMTMIDQVPWCFMIYIYICICVYIYRMINHDGSENDGKSIIQNWGECNMKVLRWSKMKLALSGQSIFFPVIKHPSKQLVAASRGPWSPLWSAKTGWFRGDSCGKNGKFFDERDKSLDFFDIMGKKWWGFHDDSGGFPRDVMWCSLPKIAMIAVWNSRWRLHAAMHTPSRDTMGYPSPWRHRWWMAVPGTRSWSAVGGFTS